MNRQYVVSWRIMAISLVVLLTTQLLSACSSSSPPLRITNIDISSTPSVGKIVTIEVSVRANDEIAFGEIDLNFLEDADNQVHLMSGKENWIGPIVPGETFRYSVQICTTQIGIWPIYVAAIAHLEGGDMPGDFENIYIESTEDGGSLIRGSDITGNFYKRIEESYSSPDVFFECAFDS